MDDQEFKDTELDTEEDEAVEGEEVKEEEDESM